MNYGARGARRIVRSISSTRAAVGATLAVAGLVALAVVPGNAQIVGWIFLPFWLLFTWRAWMLGMHIEDEGVKVVGVLLSRQVAWADIDRFEVSPLGGYPYVGHVVLRDGRQFGTFGIAAPAGPRETVTGFRCNSPSMSSMRRLSSGALNTLHSKIARCPVDRSAEEGVSNPKRDGFCAYVRAVSGEAGIS